VHGFGRQTHFVVQEQRQIALQMFQKDYVTKEAEARVRAHTHRRTQYLVEELACQAEQRVANLLIAKARRIILRRSKIPSFFEQGLRQGIHGENATLPGVRTENMLSRLTIREISIESQARALSSLSLSLVSVLS
jgi:hypothetical protein